MDPVAETIAFYDAVARDYALKWSNPDVMSEQVGCFLSHLEGQRILDIGCGPGRDALVFTNRGRRVVGIDLSKNFLAIAQRAAPSAVFAKVDMRSLAFSSGSFDGVWACASLLHLPKGEALQALQESRRVLEPHGFLFASVKEGEGEGWEEREEGKVFYSYYQEEEIRKWIEEAGFSIIRLSRSLGHTSFFDVFARAEKNAIINR